MKDPLCIAVFGGDADQLPVCVREILGHVARSGVASIPF